MHPLVPSQLPAMSLFSGFSLASWEGITFMFPLGRPFPGTFQYLNEPLIRILGGSLYQGPQDISEATLTFLHMTSPWLAELLVTCAV